MLAIALSLMAGAALAHTGVKNEAVKARMHAMGIIGQNTKVLGKMYKRQTAFDAANAIADQAARISALFEATASDPKSEALPAIWISFGDFTKKAEERRAAAQMATRISTPADLRVAMTEMGGACQACHTIYRK